MPFGRTWIADAKSWKAPRWRRSGRDDIARRAADRRTAWATSVRVNVHDVDRADENGDDRHLQGRFTTSQASAEMGNRGTGAWDLYSSRTALTFAGDES